MTKYFLTMAAAILVAGAASAGPKVITKSGGKTPASTPTPTKPAPTPSTGPGWGGGYGVPTKPTQPTGGYGVPSKPTGGSSKPYPTPSYPTHKPSYPTPSYPTHKPSYPVPGYPTPSYPVPSYPTPSYPVPSYPTPSYPAQTYPTPSYPAPSYPVEKPCYHEQYGKVFGNGFCYPGKAHKHWTYQAHWAKYNCQAFWCPSTTCYYYWYAPAECYYPISSVDEFPPTDEAVKGIAGPPAGIPPLPE